MSSSTAPTGDFLDVRISLTGDLLGVSCIWLVSVCSEDESFRWTVFQGCRCRPSKRSYPRRT